MRLIDADMLKNVLNSGGGESVEISISKKMPLGEIVDTVIHAYRKCLFAELDKIPTAYDMDNVVKELEERSNDAVSNIFAYEEDDHEGIYNDGLSEGYGISAEIVRAGIKVQGS